MSGNNWIFLFFILVSLSCAKDYSHYDNSSIVKCDKIVNEINLDKLENLYTTNGFINFIIAQENSYLYFLEILNDEYYLIRKNIVNKEIRKHSLGKFNFKYNFKVKNEIVFYEFNDNSKSRLLSYNFKTDNTKTIFEFNKIADQFDQLSDRYFLNNDLILYIENLNQQDSFKIYSYNLSDEKSLFIKTVSKNKTHIPSNFNFDVVGNDTLVYFLSHDQNNQYIIKYSLLTNNFKEVDFYRCTNGTFHDPLINDNSIYYVCITTIFEYNKSEASVKEYSNNQISSSTYPSTNGRLIAADFLIQDGENKFGITDLKNQENIRYFSSEHVISNSGYYGRQIKNEIYDEYLIYLNLNIDKTVSKYFIINLNDYCTENIIVVDNSDVHFFNEESKSFYILSKNRTEIRML